MERFMQSASVCEVSAKQTVAGRREIRVILHEIHADETQFQENGISWNEEYVLANLGSVTGMSIVAEFLSSDRDVPYGHGATGLRTKDGENLPLFEDATMVGHFDRAYIDDVELDGKTRRVLIAEGTLDEMRYPNFVRWLREQMQDGTVKGSVEIVGRAENENRIIYSDGWKPQGRVPMVYDYSGYAILSVRPADETAVVMELNNKNSEEGGKSMDEMKDAIREVLSEYNSKWEEYYARVQAKEAEITQLQADIAQLRADYEKETAARALAEQGLTEANAEKEALSAKLAEAEDRVAKMEINSAIDIFGMAEDVSRGGTDEDVNIF